MNIRTALLQEHSKIQVLKIAAYIGAAPERFAELIQLFLGYDYRITQRAAWVVSACADQHPQLLHPHLEDLILNLGQPVPDAVKRNTIRVLQYLEIPENLQGRLADICFNYLAGKEPVAIKVFAMTVLLNLSKQEPALKNELRILIEDQLPYSSPAFVARGHKTLRSLKILNT